MSKPKGPALHFLPEVEVQLRREITHHPKLLEQIVESDIDTNDFTQLVSIVSAHFNVIMDGFYSQTQIYDLADKLLLKLQANKSGMKTPLIGKPISGKAN